MSAVPFQQPISSANAANSGARSPLEAKPVLALKELVASLNREQNKIQNLLSSLGFALRSFNNLNQFLELTPLMAARVSDAEGGALILAHPDGGVRLEQLYTQNSQTSQELRLAIEQSIRQIADSFERPVRLNLPQKENITERTREPDDSADAELSSGVQVRSPFLGIPAERAQILDAGRGNSFTSSLVGGVPFQNNTLPAGKHNPSQSTAESNQVAAFLLSLDEQIRQQLEGVQVFSTSVLVKNVERGRLYVFSSDREYVWTQTRQKLAQLVADQTAVAIANHELTVELRSKERQDRELEIASEIQLRLLPRKCPQIKGVELAARCKTASRVGGDYYDFIPANYDQLRQNQEGKVDYRALSVPWSIAIGDVMGKGVPAGLIMTMTRGMLRAEVLNRHSPAKILQHLNRVMYADLENSHRFVTLFYSEYDPKTGILAYSNAAHNPPLLWQAQSHSIERLDTWGMLVGLDADSEYEDAQKQLFPGDKIIYYTDGFTDAINQNGDRFEEENLARSFKWACQQYDSSQEILDYLFNEVEQFVGLGNRHSDDRTLVVMQIKEPL